MSIAATAHEVYIGMVIPNLGASSPQLEIQPQTLSNTPGATGLLVPPQSPSGSVTGQASTWEYTNSELAVQYATTNLVNAAQKGTANPGAQPNVVAGSSPYGAVVGNKIDVETRPSAPSGTFVQQGVAQISNVAIITASWPGVVGGHNQLQLNNYTAGSVGS